ncbi:CoA transferase subunit A [Wukongibacter sp. M2B1]|uniref:CoA transferase subunit A n=1 Tax=Wukongibacter sp. M2B1 TaxID=3088895 RepID=UPI003D7A191F
MSTKVKTIEDALKYIKDGMTIMVGGFLGVGAPETLISGLIDKDIKNLTIITSDTGFPDVGTGKLIVNKVVKRVIASHIGTNPETGRQMNEGEIEVILTPQGTLAEQIRAAGAGLGGFLTPTGIGTIIEEGKKKIEIGGKEYILELPIKADVALLKGAKVDKKGNIYYDSAARNFNPLMASATDLVIVEADEIVEAGEIDANDVMTPGILVDVI